MEDDWIHHGVIFYSNKHFPVLKISMSDHTYEIRPENFIHVMETFSLLVDGKFYPSKYDSLDRLMMLDKVSKNNKCSKREQMLSDKIKVLEQEIEILKSDIKRQNDEYDDLKYLLNAVRENA